MRDPDQEKRKARARLLALATPGPREIPPMNVEIETEALWVVVFELEERLQALTKEIKRIRREL